MPLKIALRQEYKVSVFKHMMRLLLSSPVGDSAVICSGYVSESQRYSVLSDGLLDLIDNGCTNGEITIVAGMFDGNTKERFETYCAFVRRIRSIKMVRSFKSKLGNWHAKVAIRTDKGRPVAAIIGSSNLTGPAFGESSYRWNIEADVLMWVDNPAHNKHYHVNPDGLGLGIMDVILDPEVTGQAREEAQLEKIYHDVLNSRNLEDLDIN